MQSRWSDDDARTFRERLASAGEDLALRVYTSRLIGQDPDLVLPPPCITRLLSGCTDQ